MVDFSLKNKYIFGFICVVLIAATLSFYSPLGYFTATPKFWRDEAIPFEIARTFLELGKLDVVVAPNTVDGRPYLTHATGFPLTIPLAGFMGIFGVGVVQARIFMVIWIFATLATLFFVLRDFFGKEAAFWGTLLVSTFGPFYANGRTTTGEIPGLLFLLWGLWFLYRREKYAISGVFFALAAVTKPSVFLLIFPAVAIEFLVSERARELAPRALRFWLGTLPVIFLWIWIILPGPFSPESWRAMIDLYRHPFNEPSLISRFPGLVLELTSHTTVLYVAALFIFLILAFRIGAFGGKSSRWALFLFLYSLMSIIYFLRSPGWLRYLLISEILILSSLYPALLHFVKKASWAPPIIIILLSVLHLSNFFLFSDIQSGTGSIDTAEFINNELLDPNPRATIGVIHMPTVAPLLPPDRKYQIATIGGREVYGKNPLFLELEKLPAYIIGFEDEGREVLEKFYKPYTKAPNGYIIYKKQ